MTPARPGWYTGRISAKHPALGLAELMPASGKFSILVPIRKFPKVLHSRAGQAVEFSIGDFGGVLEVQIARKPRATKRASQGKVHVPATG
jgi:hypothetical protein